MTARLLSGMHGTNTAYVGPRFFMLSNIALRGDDDRTATSGTALVIRVGLTLLPLFIVAHDVHFLLTPDMDLSSIYSYAFIFDAGEFGASERFLPLKVSHYP